MKNCIKTVLMLSVLLGISSGLTHAEQVIDESKNPEMLIAVTGSSGTYSDNTLPLNGVPSVVYFSDHAGRVSV